MKTKSRKTVLVLRTCSNKDMTSHNGFKWPKTGMVEAPDWDGGKMVCGGGLHGLEMGEQSGKYLDWSPDAVWLVVKVTVADGYATGDGELKDKCKFRRGVVVYCGAKDGAVKYLLSHGANPQKCVCGTSTSGDSGTSTSGYGGTSTSGYSGTSTSGYRGTSTSSGNHGLSLVGRYGKVRSRDKGVMLAEWWDDTNQRRRIATAYVGEDGIKADAWYKVEGGKFVEVK
jgi:hypothetical protein